MDSILCFIIYLHVFINICNTLYVFYFFLIFLCFHVQILSHVTSLVPQSNLQDKDNICYLINVLGDFRNHFSVNVKTSSLSWKPNLQLTSQCMCHKII